MTNNDPLPRLTKKHNMSSSLWSSLPVTALLRGQQNERKESFLSSAQQDQDEEREREKEDFLLAAQGPNLLLLPWEGGEPHERLQVQEQSAKCKSANMDNIYCLSLQFWCHGVFHLSCNIFAHNRSFSGFPFKCNPWSPVGGVGACACEGWKEQGHCEGQDEEEEEGGGGGGHQEDGDGGGRGVGGGLAARLPLHRLLPLPLDRPQQVAGQGGGEEGGEGLLWSLHLVQVRILSK